MKKNYLYINIASDGLGSSTREELESMYHGDDVEYYHFHKIAMHYKKTSKLLTDKDGNLDHNILQLRKYVKENKIDTFFFSVHGKKDDADNCYTEENSYGMAAEKQILLFNAETNAKFIIDLFGGVGVPDKINLLMCYGGRSADHNKNHINESINPLSSYAYKLFFHLREKQKKILSLSSRIGAVAIDDNGILCLTEEYYSLSKKVRDLINVDVGSLASIDEKELQLKNKLGIVKFNDTFSKAAEELFELRTEDDNLSILCDNQLVGDLLQFYCRSLNGNDRSSAEEILDLKRKSYALGLINQFKNSDWRFNKPDYGILKFSGNGNDSRLCRVTMNFEGKCLTLYAGLIKPPQQVKGFSNNFSFSSKTGFKDQEVIFPAYDDSQLKIKLTEPLRNESKCSIM